MKILSYGGGMQSTALALMSCEKALKGKELWPDVPVYDYIIFCDLGLEPPWVAEQVAFVQNVCETAGIQFRKLDSPLHQDFLNNFGERRTISIPWWTLAENGKKAMMPRYCTIDYKIVVIAKYVRHQILGYKRHARLREEDKKAHEIHMGFSMEEKRRCKENSNPMFVNKFPLVEMKYERADSYAYSKNIWGLDTKASSCSFCPFHTNSFYAYIKETYPEHYDMILEIDRTLRDKTPKPPMDSDLFISKSRKRISELTPEDCNDGEFFLYNGQPIWNGF